MAVRLPKSVFVHIPKTGGTWVRRVLRTTGLYEGDVARDHATPAELAAFPVATARPIFFCFVRHPLTWYQSYWAYRMKNGWHRPSPSENELPLPIRTILLDANCRADDFETFVRNCLARYPAGWVSHLFRHYTTGCAFVGRQERLRDDLLLALRIAGERLMPSTVSAIRTIRRENTAGTDAEYAAKCQYTPELREAVLHAERDVLNTWGYGPEPPVGGLVPGESIEPLPDI